MSSAVLPRSVGQSRAGSLPARRSPLQFHRRNDVFSATAVMNDRFRRRAFGKSQYSLLCANASWSRVQPPTTNTPEELTSSTA